MAKALMRAGQHEPVKLKRRPRRRQVECVVPRPLKYILFTIGSVCSGLSVEKLALQFLLGPGYQLVSEAFSCDIDANVKSFNLANFPRSHHFFDDCCSDEFHYNAPAVDILVAGFPCQPFSSTGLGLGEKDRPHAMRAALSNNLIVRRVAHAARVHPLLCARAPNASACVCKEVARYA